MLLVLLHQFPGAVVLDDGGVERILVPTVRRSSLCTSISKLAKQKLSNIWERCGLINLRILNGSGFEVAIMGSFPQKSSAPLWERRLRRDFEVGRAK